MYNASIEICQTAKEDSKCLVIWEKTPSSWAIRFAASLDGIITVLSGMSNIQQMEDNLSYMKDFQPLSDAEQEVIKKAQAALAEDKSIPCTACHYCTGGCPQNIPIPEIFAVKNDAVLNGAWDGGKRGCSIATANKGKASECIQCGQCEAAAHSICRLSSCWASARKRWSNYCFGFCRYSKSFL